MALVMEDSLLILLNRNDLTMKISIFYIEENGIIIKISYILFYKSNKNNFFVKTSFWIISEDKLNLHQIYSFE